MSNPLISLILCSRNDSYMGNSRWRLETSINLALLNARDANFLDKLEIIVSDWGSEVPLSEVLNLVPEAEGRVKFVYVPPDIAKVEQKDSKFPEVIALNAAVRRASGEYIGRIDNDTIVGDEFFRNFISVLKKKNKLWFDLETSFLFVERRSVPYRFSSKSYNLLWTYKYIKHFSNSLMIESAREWGFPFWWSPVGIMLFNRKIWQNCRGYDEKLIYWGWMEGDMALRLNQKHHLIDFKDLVGNNFYHLEHYPSMTHYKDRNGPATPRKKNVINTEGLKYSANEDGWGLKSKMIKLNTIHESHCVKPFNSEKQLLHDKIIMNIIFLKCNILRKIDLLFISDINFFIRSQNFFKILLGRLKKVIFSL